MLATYAAPLLGSGLLSKSYHKKIASAGLGALKGHSADDTAIEVASENNLSLEGHVAQQLTATLCRQYDLILVMEKKHIDAVSGRDANLVL